MGAAPSPCFSRSTHTHTHTHTPSTFHALPPQDQLRRESEQVASSRAEAGGLREALGDTRAELERCKRELQVRGGGVVDTSPY